MNTKVYTQRIRVFLLLTLAFIFALLVLFQGCSNEYNVTGIESSDPGILRIYIQSDNADTSIVVAGDTVVVGSSLDSLDLNIGQGRAYRDTNYAVLYKSIDTDSSDSYRERTKTVNIIKQNDVGYEEYLMFESYLPVATFDSLKISITARFLRIGYYQIPIEMPDSESALIRFDDNFDIHEGRVTEIHLQIKPFQSLVRVVDSFHFIQDIEVADIKYL